MDDAGAGAPSGLNIVVATAPRGLSLEEEIRLSKPALLYGDRVTLYSAAAMMLASSEQIAHLEGDELIDFLDAVSDAIPGAEEAVAGYRFLRDKRHRTKKEMLEFFKMKRDLRDMAAAVGEAVQPMLEEAGADELVPAIAQGLLLIDPLLRETSADEEELHEAFFEKLRDLLVSRSHHPLFDEQVGSLVRAAINEGMFELGVTAGRRAKGTGVASGFMAQVPGFPDATIAEILDVREELREPLGRFRAIVSQFSRRLETAAHDEDFAAEVEDLYRVEVAPVIQEIREAVEANTYLRQLRRQTGENVEKTLLTGAAMTIGLMGLADASAVADVVIGAGAAAVQAGTAARLAQRDEVKAIERNHLFFLYKTEQLLERR